MLLYNYNTLLTKIDLHEICLLFMKIKVFFSLLKVIIEMFLKKTEPFELILFRW
jgi:hypothetical protein